MTEKQEITHLNAAKQPFMPVLRELVRAYQAFASYDAAGQATSGLTVPQADVVFTLGNTQGMSFKEIGEKTLITKGTLTGVIERLEAKGLVRKTCSESDRRSIIVSLTPKGKSVFEKEFPRHIAYLGERFGRLSAAELKEAERVLRKLKEVFS